MKVKRKHYNIVYAISMISIIVVFLAIPQMKDIFQMILGAIAITLTSIFTYSNRHEVSRKKR